MIFRAHHFAVPSDAANIETGRNWRKKWPTKKKRSSTAFEEVGIFRQAEKQRTSLITQIKLKQSRGNSLRHRTNNQSGARTQKPSRSSLHLGKRAKNDGPTAFRGGTHILGKNAHILSATVGGVADRGTNGSGRDGQSPLCGPKKAAIARKHNVKSSGKFRIQAAQLNKIISVIIERSTMKLKNLVVVGAFFLAAVAGKCTRSGSTVFIFISNTPSRLAINHIGFRVISWEISPHLAHSQWEITAHNGHGARLAQFKMKSEIDKADKEADKTIALCNYYNARRAAKQFPIELWWKWRKESN